MAPRRLRRSIALLMVAIVASMGLSPATAAPDDSSSDHQRRALTDKVLEPRADAYVWARRPNKNTGGAKSLRAQRTPNAISYIKFKVPAGIGDVATAKLQLRVKSSEAARVVVRHASSNWAEGKVTARRKPALGHRLGAVNIPAGGRRWVTIDVSNHVDGPGRYTFALSTRKGDRAVFASSESTRSPVLRLTTSTPTPPAGGGQPAAPIRAAFFYPWFPNAWDQGAQVPYSQFTPSAGMYSSSHRGTIDRQVRQATTAGLEAFIASWWGAGHHTDAATKAFLRRIPASPNPAFRTAIYYEPEGYGDPSASEIVGDLTYLERLFDEPTYLRINGKPVVFVWAESSDGGDMAARWADAKRRYGKGLHVVLKLYSGYRDDPNQPDSWHQYGPASPYSEHLPWSANVSPGFYHAEEGSARLARDPARFRGHVRQMVRSGAFWQLVTSWNEWGEGTPVEPATQFSTTYLDILEDELR